jgi:hypothetical protein
LLSCVRYYFLLWLYFYRKINDFCLFIFIISHLYLNSKYMCTWRGVVLGKSDSWRHSYSFCSIDQCVYFCPSSILLTKIFLYWYSLFICLFNICIEFSHNNIL